MAYTPCCYPLISIRQTPLDQLDLERLLLPAHKDLAIVLPAILPGHGLIVKSVKQPRNNNPHFRVRKVPGQAVPGAKTERAECLLVVVLEGRVIKLVRRGEPPLGAERAGFVEVGWIPVRRVLEGDADELEDLPH